MKSFVGIGKGDLQRAVDEAVKEIGTPKGIIFMTDYKRLAQVAEILHNRFPNVPSIGTVGTSFACGQVSDSHLVVIAFYEDAKLSFGVLEEISECPIAEIKKVEESLNAVGAQRKDTVCLQYCTGAEEKLVTTLQTVLGKKQIQLIGGTVFGVPEGKPLQVAYQGKVYEDASVYAMIRNTTGKINVYKENIYQKRLEAKGHIATRVDVSRRALIELDGKSVADVYSSEIGISKSEIMDNVFFNPMGRVVGNEVFIASIKSMDSQGSFLNYKRINKNDCLYFLELGDYKQIEEETRKQIKEEMSHISLIISIDCAYRYLLYTQNGFIGTYAKEMARLGKHAGIIGGGEQYNKQHVNQTMVCAVFE